MGSTLHDNFEIKILERLDIVDVRGWGLCDGCNRFCNRTRSIPCFFYIVISYLTMSYNQPDTHNFFTALDTAFNYPMQQFITSQQPGRTSSYRRKKVIPFAAPNISTNPDAGQDNLSTSKYSYAVQVCLFSYNKIPFGQSYFVCIVFHVVWEQKVLITFGVFMSLLWLPVLCDL